MSGDNELPDPADLPNLGDFQMPNVEDLLAALEGMEGLTEENKRELRESLLSRAEQGGPNILGDPEAVASSGTPPDLIILLSMLTVVALIFVFFGYRLYQSLAEREKRKEEKRKQKQQKKRR